MGGFSMVRVRGSAKARAVVLVATAVTARAVTPRGAITLCTPTAMRASTHRHARKDRVVRRVRRAAKGKLDVPAARYNSIDDLLTDPHLKDVGFFKEEDHPSQGRLRRTRLANTFSGGARNEETHAPLMGEQTCEILAEAGYAQAEIEALLADGAAG